MNCSMPGFPVLHYLLEFAQTQVHWVSDAIQLSYPLSPPSPPAFNLSQHQGLFQWISSSHQVAKVLEPQLQHSSFQWIFRTDLLAVQGLSGVFFSTKVWKPQFFSTQPPLWSNSHVHTGTGKTIALTIWTFVGKVMSLLFNVLSRFILVFLARSKCLLISWM